MNTLIVLLIPLFALGCGMWFGRNAPHRPKYDKLSNPQENN